MRTIDTQKLDELMKAKRWDEARALLEELFKGDLSEEEKGAVYVEFAKLSMDLKDKIDADYERALDETIAALKGEKQK